MWYIYLHEWSIFCGKCREIYHTLSVWEKHTHMFLWGKKNIPGLNTKGAYWWKGRWILPTKSLYTKYLFRKRPGSDFCTPPKESSDHMKMSFLLWLYKLSSFPWNSKQPLYNGCFVKQHFFMERFGSSSNWQPTILIRWCFRFQVWFKVFQVNTFEFWIHISLFLPTSRSSHFRAVLEQSVFQILMTFH